MPRQQYSIRSFFTVLFLMILFLPNSVGATNLDTDAIVSGAITDGIIMNDPDPDASPTLTISPLGTVTTGPGVIGVDFTSFDYTLLNQGNITGNTDGVSSDFGSISDVTVNNENSIIGLNADGVFLGDTGTVTNNVAGALIQGLDFGVWIQNGGVVENNGAGAMITSTNNNGADVGGTGMVTNGGLGAMITGGLNGVFVAANGLVNNSGEGAKITGLGAAGVLLNSGGTVTNSGLGAMITGVVDGIRLAAGGTVDNTGTNATITGTTTGVNATGGTGLVNNSGNTAMINGGVDGINFAAGGTVNNSGNTASITGATNGINFTAGGTVNNSGANATITGTAGNGVLVTGGSAIITNNANSFITGLTGGIVTGTSGDIISNMGTVTSTGVSTAIDSGGGADSITVSGTVVSGGALAIDAGTGNDTVNLESGASINKDIDGNTGTDTANLSGTGTFTHEFLNFSTLNMNSGDWILNSGGTHSVADTQINGGILRLNAGTTLDGTVTVNDGGILGGDTGIITGLLSTMGGTIAPGNSIGTLTADSLDMSAGGNLEIEFDASSSDRLLLNGSTSPILSGGTVTFVPLELFAGQVTYEFIDDTTDSNAVGAEMFSNIAFSPLYTITVLYDMNEGPAAETGSVSATIERTASFTALADTPNRKAIAEILEANVVSATGDAALVIAAVSGGVGLDGLLGSIDQLSPDTLASIPRIKIQEHRNFKESLVQRLGALRLGDDFSKNKGVAQLALANIDPSFLANYVTARPRKGSTTNRAEWSPFFRAFGSMSDLDTEVDHFGFESGTYGVTFGVDKRINSNLSLGAAGGYASTKTEFDNLNTQGNMHTFHLAAFGEYSVNRFRLDSVVSYAHSVIDMDRRISLGIVDRVATSDHIGNEFLIHGGAGYDFDLGGLLIGPVGSMEYIALIEDGFVERGAGAANLVIDGRTTDSFRTIAGLRAAKQFQFKKLMIVPEAHAKWTHEWLDNPQTLQAQFTGIPGPAFGIVSRELPDDGANVGFGITGYQNEMAFNISYQSEFGRSDFINHVFDIGLKMSFF